MVDLEVTEEPGWSVGRLLVLSARKARVPRGWAAHREQLRPTNMGMARARGSWAGAVRAGSNLQLPMKVRELPESTAGSCPALSRAQAGDVLKVLLPAVL